MINKTSDHLYTIWGCGEGEGFHLVTREELESLKVEIENIMLNEDMKELMKRLKTKITESPPCRRTLNETVR